MTGRTESIIDKATLTYPESPDCAFTRPESLPGHTRPYLWRTVREVC